MVSALTANKPPDFSPPASNSRNPNLLHYIIDF